ncbi:MAG TPA: hemerythrin domain-containing protein [Lachnospiraceae bacterium]|nr:hemerythrin domain-containing protein [Lachnospiraceae bacterium]
MYGIDILVKEHENILKFTRVLKKKCCDILDGQEINTAEFREYIEFGRNYADKHHHGKEEKVLFRVMLEQLGTIAEKLIQNGMLVEHDLGRFHMTELEHALNRYDENPSVMEKLNIISNAAGYANLLTRHIDKEDSVAYTYAERALDKKTLEYVNDETRKIEREAEENNVQSKYLHWLNQQVE